MGAGMHLSLPTGLAKAKRYLQDEYLHDIQTDYYQRYFFYRAKCFHSFKSNENPHNLDLALCIVSGDVTCMQIAALLVQPGSVAFAIICWH